MPPEACGEPVKVDYMMRRNGDSWLISDICLDGAISEVATRRSEFATILRNDGHRVRSRRSTARPIFGPGPRLERTVGPLSKRAGLSGRLASISALTSSRAQLA